MNKAHVKIVNQYTLELENDAKKGDQIDLKEITSIDTNLILQKINDQTDKVYEQKLNEYKKALLLEKEIELKEVKETLETKNRELKEKYTEQLNSAQYQLKELENKVRHEQKELLSDAAHKLNTETTQLKNEIAMIKERTIAEQGSLYNKEINSLKLELNTLEAEKKQVETQKDTYYNEIINKLKNEVETYKKDIKTSEELLETKHINKIQELDYKYKEQLSELEKQIDVLKREKGSLNVKKIGENLEKWCDQEFQNQSLALLDFVTWQKDNEVIKNGKADFIYKVYANNKKDETEVLTSAVLEMKSEDPNSTNHQPNQKFFKKLNDDRNNKGLEYAILVSELEWETTNDAPIQKISDYEKMYLVRPQYFTVFLNIITTFGIKYKEIFLDKKEEQLKFKDSQEILDEFENMKSEILENSLKNIVKNIEVIINQSETITKANNKLLEAAQMIINKHIITIENKINDFKIKRIVTKIEKLDSKA